MKTGLEKRKLKFPRVKFDTDINGIQLIGLVLIVLKLKNIISLNWGLVLLPLWGPVVIVGLILILVIVGYITDKL